MIVEKDVKIPVEEGAVLWANLFRPEGPLKVPVLVTHGPYGKDAHFADVFQDQWNALKALYPELDQGESTGQYLRWEVPDPERWVPKGFAILVVDSRGAGKSPGKLWAYSSQETHDHYQVIEWAGTQEWCNGNVGLVGVSYYATNQWQVAAMQPPHLAAIVPWEGFCDFYRDYAYHGGIHANSFPDLWWPKQILSVQNGNGASHYFDRETGARTTGTPLSPDQLERNRVSLPLEMAAHTFDDEWFQARTPDLSKITVPVLSGGNWGGLGLHLRGNVEGYLGAGSKQKWLEIHGGTHFETFYLPEYVALQMRFLDHFLKGEENGWDKEPPVILHVRHPGAVFVVRKEREWPLARTEWTKYFLDADRSALAPALPETSSALTFEGMSFGPELSTAPFSGVVEITGPINAVLWISSTTTDMDLFLTLRAYSPNGDEIVFRGATDPAVPISQGWLRASHRVTDSARSTPWRPFRSHRVATPLTLGEKYRVEIEIWPTSIVLPRGARLALRIDGRDFEREGAIGPRKGSGPFLHTNPANRPPSRFNGNSSIWTGGMYDSHLVLPFIPHA